MQNFRLVAGSEIFYNKNMNYISGLRWIPLNVPRKRITMVLFFYINWSISLGIRTFSSYVRPSCRSLLLKPHFFFLGALAALSSGFHPWTYLGRAPNQMPSGLIESVFVKIAHNCIKM